MSLSQFSSSCGGVGGGDVVGLVGSCLLGGLSAGWHDSVGGSVASEQLGEVVGVLIASADVWVVFFESISHLTIVAKLLGSKPDGGDEVPEVVSERGHGASEWVDGSLLVEGQVWAQHLWSGSEDESSSSHELSDGKLETSWSHWDSSSLASCWDGGTAVHCKVGEIHF